MNRPVLEILLTTPDQATSTVKAVFDTGSFYSILREDKVPPGGLVHRRKTPRIFRTAAQGKQFQAQGELPVVLTIGDRMVDDVVFVSSDLAQEMLVGAGTMQKWDISIVTRSGRTEVVVGRDMRDPDINDVV
jgi:hypothetical protein